MIRVQELQDAVIELFQCLLSADLCTIDEINGMQTKLLLADKNWRYSLGASCPVNETDLTTDICFAPAGAPTSENVRDCVGTSASVAVAVKLWVTSSGMVSATATPDRTGARFASSTW